MVAEFSKYTEMIEQVIENVHAAEPRINPKWDPELEELAAEIKAVEADVAKQAARAEDWGLDVKCERDSQT